MHQLETMAHPLPHVTPRQIALNDGGVLQVVPQVPFQAALRRAAVDGSTLYAFVGPRIDLAPTAHGPYVGGYVGKSEALADRAGTSWRYWVLAQRAFDPVAMVLLHRSQRYDPNELSVTEARVIARLASDMGSLALTNTHSSAETAAARLTPPRLTAAVQLGDTIAHLIWQHALGCWTNPWPAPAPNLREAAIRVVQRASNLEQRGIDLTELCARLEANGYPSAGRTRWRSVRRDIADREQRTGAPRAHAVAHRGRIVFHANTLPTAQALAGYDAAHPRFNRAMPPRSAGR